MEHTIKPYRGNEKYIFISYAHKDSKSVLPIISRLQNEGYRVWYDEGIPSGIEWDVCISRRVKECGYMFAFVSRNYFDSKNCKDELNHARDKDKPVLLVYLDNVTLPDGMDMRFSRTQSVYKYKHKSEQTFYEKLFDTEGISVCIDTSDSSPKIPTPHPSPVPLNVIRKKYSNGVYEGEVNEEGKRHGKGKYTWSNGNIYEGDFVEGKCTGTGKYIFANGNLYEGGFENGQRTGYGKLTRINGEIYEGDWADDKKNGKGKYTWPDGFVYEGEFKDDDFSNIADINQALTVIFKKYGFEIINQDKRLVSTLSKYAPSLEKEIRLIGIILDTGVYSELLNADITKTETETGNEVLSAAVDKLTEFYFLDKKWSVRAVAWLTEQLDGSYIEKNKALFTPVVLEKIKVGDSITFGSYPQSSLKNSEPLEWEIIAIEDDRALLHSKKCIDSKLYSYRSGSCIWELSELREWLNDSFFNQAFTVEDQKSIIEAEVHGSCNPRSGVHDNSITRDKIFILSHEEIKYYIPDIKSMQCQATLFAKSNGAFYDKNTDIATWWIRTPGYTRGCAMYTMSSGKPDELGCNVEIKIRGVRPAVWVELNIF